MLMLNLYFMIPLFLASFFHTLGLKYYFFSTCLYFVIMIFYITNKSIFSNWPLFRKSISNYLIDDMDKLYQSLISRRQNWMNIIRGSFCKISQLGAPLPSAPCSFILWRCLWLIYCAIRLRPMMKVSKFCIYYYT